MLPVPAPAKPAPPPSGLDRADGSCSHPELLEERVDVRLDLDDGSRRVGELRRLQAGAGHEQHHTIVRPDLAAGNRLAERADRAARGALAEDPGGLGQEGDVLADPSSGTE